MKSFFRTIFNRKEDICPELKESIDYIHRNIRKFSLNNKNFSSEKNPFTEINIFKPENRQLYRCFLFFLAIAICGYLSVMILSVPYRDDWYRYFWNSHVGGSEALRGGTALIEYLFYLSNITTDAAPFSQILSCMVLAYLACIILRILKVDIENKWKIICFAPIVVNPYLLEIMLFRFDNFFMALSLLIVSIAAYISSLNRKDCFIVQTLLLFLSLFVYQVAISIYLTIFMYEFMKKIRSGNGFFSVIHRMKYWFYTLVTTALGYAPLLRYLTYYKAKDGSVLALPYNLENTKAIINNIFGYFNTLHNDWSHSTIGLIFLIMICIFIITSLIETAKTTKSGKSMLLVFFCIFVLTICPSGLYICLKYKETASVPPRLLCGAGVFIAIVHYEVYLLLKKTKVTDLIIKTTLCLTVIWNLMFINSAVNIMRENFKARSLLEYDIAKDVFEISKTYSEISHFGIIGEIKTQTNKNFFKLYPITNRFITENFRMLAYYRLGLSHHELSKRLIKDKDVFFYEPKYRSKKLIKKHMMYNMYILDNRILQIVLRKDKNYEKSSRFIMKIGRK